MTTPSNVIQYRRTGRDLPSIPRNPDCSLFRTYERVVPWQMPEADALLSPRDSVE